MVELRWLTRIPVPIGEAQTILQYRQKPDFYIYPEEWPYNIPYESAWSEWKEVQQVKEAQK